MADIKKAMEWLKNGNQVRRKAWHPDVPNLVAEHDAVIDKEWTEIVHATPVPDEFTDKWCIGDILANDWELSEATQ